MSRAITVFFLLPFILVLLSANGNPIDAKFNQPVEVAPSVWFVLRDSHGTGLCNNVIIEMKEYMIVVDANFPAGAQLTMEEVKQLTRKPVKYVFDTHHHGDHLYGNQVWTKAGAITLAYKGVLDGLAHDEPKEWNSTAKYRKDVGDLKTGPEPPQQTFSEDIYVIDDGWRRVEFRHLGWGHTPGDAVVYLPKEKILCTGDLAVSGHFTNLDDGDIRNWPKILNTLLQLDVNTVLPGHGNAGGKEILIGQRDFILDLTHAVETAMAQGKQLKDLVGDDQKSPQVNIKLPSDVSNWLGHSLARQVATTYRDLAAEKSNSSQSQNH